MKLFDFNKKKRKKEKGERDKKFTKKPSHCENIEYKIDFVICNHFFSVNISTR